MSVWEALAVCVLCAVLGFILREVKSPMAALLPPLCGLGVLLATLLRLSALSDLFALLEQAGVSEAASLSLRVLGIGYLGEIGGELCRDLGATGLGGRIEQFAGVEIFLLCLPYLTDLLKKAIGLLS